MKLELNELLREIYSWKNLLKKKDEEIENLQKQLSFTHKQNEVLENSRTSLYHEVSELNNAVSSLQNSFRKVEDFEGDRKILLEEKQKLKNSLESLEKLYYDQNKNMRQELQKAKEVNKEETSVLISQIQNKAYKQVKNLERELEKKENDTNALKREINKLLKEKDDEVLKIKIQYEDKIGKLKQQIPKSRVQASHGLQMHDVFRQKYLKLEKESEDEIFKLKEQIKSLQSLTESLRAKSGSLSSVLLATNKQSATATVNVSIQTESPTLTKFNMETDDEIDFMLKKKKFNKTQSVVLPQKRKLFNLNGNYYVK